MSHPDERYSPIAGHVPSVEKLRCKVKKKMVFSDFTAIISFSNPARLPSLPRSHIRY